MAQDTKESVAQEFIDHHKYDLQEFSIGFPSFWTSKHCLEEIYDRLIDGKYGNVSETGYPNEYMIEIQSQDSKTGQSVDFTYFVDSRLPNTNNQGAKQTLGEPHRH